MSVSGSHGAHNFRVLSGYRSSSHSHGFALRKCSDSILKSSESSVCGQQPGFGSMRALFFFGAFFAVAMFPRGKLLDNISLPIELFVIMPYICLIYSMFLIHHILKKNNKIKNINKWLVHQGFSWRFSDFSC